MEFTLIELRQMRVEIMETVELGNTELSAVSFEILSADLVSNDILYGEIEESHDCTVGLVGYGQIPCFGIEIWLATLFGVVILLTTIVVMNRPETYR